MVSDLFQRIQAPPRQETLFRGLLLDSLFRYRQHSELVFRPNRRSALLKMQRVEN